MSIASSLIAVIDAWLASNALRDDDYPRRRYPCLQRIGLRNLKSVLFCVRSLGDHDRRLRSASLFTRIQTAVTFLKDLKHDDEAMCPFLDLPTELMYHVQIRLTSRSASLTPDDIVGIADCFLHNILDFSHLCKCYSSVSISTSLRIKLDAAEVLISWSLKNVLLFAMLSGIPALKLTNYSRQIQPLAICAAGVFGTSAIRKRIDGVQSNCATLLDMATSLKLYEAYTCVLRSSKLRIHPGMDYEHVLDYLVSLLWDVLRLNDHYIFVKDGLKGLYERLRFSRSALKQPLDGNVMDQIGVLVCDVGIFIFSLFQADVLVDLGLVLNLVERFDDIFLANELKFGNSTNIIEDMMKSVKISSGDGDGDREDLKVEKGREMQPPESGFQVVGFKEEELNSILDQLSGGISKNLCMVAIHGMAGIGKTTLALKAFNIASIRCNFQAFAWCTISQVLDKKKVFVELLNQVHPSPSYSNMVEDDLANMLRQSLKGKKYMILLDDVWSNEAWNSLAGSFPDDSKHSRIILTSRNHGVAPPGLLVNRESHLLRLREDYECLDILKSKLFPEKDVWPGELSEFGMRIAAECKGLPLTATIVAGLLATKKLEDWNGILDDLSLGVVSGAEQCNNSLELSYNHLTNELRHCFLYFGAYPEDYVVPVRELIQLWMAEGLVKNDSLNGMKDVATRNLNGLIERNLVMITEKRSIGGVKTCRVHDVLHEFCVKRAKQENFFHILLQRYGQLSNFIEPHTLQRLCIHSELNHFIKSMLFCPRALSLLFFPTQGKEESYMFDMSFIIQIYKLVQVLDIGKIRLHSEIPSEMQFLTHLKYLSVSSRVGGIPWWIGNLSNLETLIVDLWNSKNTSLPETLWNLRKLKYLYIKGNFICLPTENLDNSLVLSELETLVGVVFDASYMEKQMRKFPNIRRLKCKAQRRIENTGEFIKIVIPGLFTQLESLSILAHGKPICEFCSLKHLRKVRLEELELSRDAVSMMGNFPRLEILKLVDIPFRKGTLAMEEGAFSKLRILVLIDILGNLKRWTATDELPCLEKLVLRNCKELKELPPSLETISTLEKIEVIYCCTYVEGLVREIEKVQNDFGNLMEVRIERRQL